ncbi:haloacid dehalogenase superfamily, subfamily IA, variant 3 with third motif having DD or ED [Desulfonatronum thiosulfatophilum]|uniref:Haloacid dehalogenase superfamily, subfamily IA, variant 3 with third motif having DD or ED n=1 Tax=Desulfonatronum thiosulfatophilum TaxID=617002 RepID=A0A1G6AH61_9BACT|nr:HAD-IA family hydrolase [Desulfonatronum thiosulfatophilum]SDB07699.1 haloacid dehalogenase superfamily, subfamily IA, variant 3 with third motif having DD or ED [Desulfonatronum thiosulfatophilum]
MTGVKPKAAIFDLGGVLTSTDHLHAKAWEETLNPFLESVAEKEGSPFRPFDPQNDYRNHLERRPAFEGALSFFKSRNIEPPYGRPDDGPEAQTIHGLSRRKNDLFLELLNTHGPKVIDTSVDLLKTLKNEGFRIGIISSSLNCDCILKLAGLEGLYDVRMDEEMLQEQNLKEKPQPDMMLAAARAMECYPGECLVVDDTLAGVRAGRAGNFGMIIGLATNGNGEMFRQFGADLVLGDLTETCPEDIRKWFEQDLQNDGWKHSYTGLERGDEKLRETLTTVGNGYMGVRGCFEGERASFYHYPGMYLAGIFNRVPSMVHGREIFNNDFVNCPNWLPVEFKIGNSKYLSPLQMELLSYKQELDLRRGVLHRTMICRDVHGLITRIQSSRLASMAEPHLCALRYELTPINYSAPITMRVSLDGNVENTNVPRYSQLTSKHLELIHSGKTADGLSLRVKTSASGYQIHMEARTRLLEDNKKLSPERSTFKNNAEIGEELRFQAYENRTYALEKTVAVYTSLDGVQDLSSAASSLLGKHSAFNKILSAHERAWAALWDKADIRIQGDRFVQRTVRLHIYHLLVTASPHNRLLYTGMPARGLHGEAYRGHIFWDEIYILPFFDLHFPEISRSLLLYRYHRLNGAREYARSYGFKGAMYPWQTADGGEEETQEIHYNPAGKTWDPDLSRRQRHVSIAIFANVWRYVELAKDEQFLRDYGAEMLLEIARFWADIANHDPETGKYHIEGVMGPDEFHEELPGNDEPGVKDNAYTNVMVVWLLEQALKLVDRLPGATLRKLQEQIDFKIEETEKWRDMIRKLNVLMTPEGIIHQFDGYMDLDELDWDAYRRRYYDIHRMDRILKAEGDSPDHYKVAKQADVLMMYYLLEPDEVAHILRELGHEVDDPRELLQKNYDYYEPRTSHGSTLSKVVHAVVSYYIHSDAGTWRWFVEAMKSDVYDTQGGTTKEGIHTGVMAATLDIILRCFAGLHLGGPHPVIQPRLPEHWQKLTFRFQLQRTWYDVELEHGRARVSISGREGEERVVQVGEKILHLLPGRCSETTLPDDPMPMDWSISV